MNNIWWEKVANPCNFLKSIVQSVKNEESIILELPEYVPWYMTMRSIISDQIMQSNSTRQYNYIKDIDIEPGEYLFNEFCKKEKRARYRPSIGYAEFLAKSDDIVLNDCILWIYDVSKSRAVEWYNFIVKYNKAIDTHKNRCIIIVETREDNNLQEKKEIKKISYQKEIGHYDNYLFNMMMSATLKESMIFKQYLAESVSLMFHDDIELSAQCISYGRAFLENPMEILHSISEQKLRSDGEAFEIKISEEEIEKQLWEAQIKVVFPLIEKHRNNIVCKYRKEIDLLLPIKTEYDEEIKTAGEVEIGKLLYLAVSKQINMSVEDFSKVSKLKNARNVLAHIKSLKQEDVDELFLL